MNQKSLDKMFKLNRLDKIQTDAYSSGVKMATEHVMKSPSKIKPTPVSREKIIN